MVTAPGYDPIVITRTESNTNADGTPKDSSEVEIYKPNATIIDNYKEFLANQTSQ